MKGNNIKLVQEVNRRKVELIVYAAFFMGFQASYEKRSPDNQDNFREIHNLIDLISKDYAEPKRESI